MRDKWNVRKKGYLKIHVAVDVKSKKILSMKVTDEHVHDSKVLSECLSIFRYLTDNGIYIWIY